MRKRNFLFFFFLFTSVVCADWQYTNGPVGSKSSQVNAFEFLGNKIFAGTEWGIYIPNTDFTEWTTINSPIFYTKVVYALKTSKMNIIAGTERNVAISSDSGKTWKTGGSDFNSNNFRSLVVKGDTVFAGTFGGGIYISTNNGNDWKKSDSGLRSSSIIYSLAIKDSIIFAGTGSDGIYISRNNGLSWSKSDSGLPPYTSVYSIAACGSKILAGTKLSGMFRSINNGLTWERAGNGLPDSVYVNTLAVYDTNIFAGISYDDTKPNHHSVWLSKNKGADWEVFDAGLTTSPVLSLAIYNASLFAGTSSEGIWYRPLSDLKSDTKTSKRLYNNPAITYNNSHLTLKLPYSTKTVIDIYNLNGKHVSNIVNCFCPAGEHLFLYDSRKLKSGFFILVMNTSEFKVVKKISIQK